MRATVGTKIGAAFAAITIVLAGIASYSALRHELVDARIELIYTRGATVTQDLGRAATLLQRARSRSFFHAATSDPAEMERIEREIADIERDLDAALAAVERKFPDDDVTRVHLAGIRQNVQSYRDIRASDVLPLSRANDQQGAIRAMLARTRPPFDRANDALDALISANIERTRRLHDEARGALGEARRVSLVASLAAAVMALVLATWLSRNISRRLGGLAEVADQIARGARHRRADVAGGDEIADLARSFNAMTDELGANLDEQREAGEALRTTVAEYGAFVDRIAHGDLTATLPELDDGTMATLGDNLRAMAASLRQITVNVDETVQALTAATAEISSTAQEQSTSATESAAAVTETVTTVEQATRTAQRTAEGAQVVANGARQTIDASNAGRGAVDRTVGAMHGVKRQVDAIATRILGLSEQAQAVGQIVTTVNDIAEQSNLLALNAAIEAARAGEHGRGFAVVAQEVRNLAEQSKRATAEIRVILNDIQKSTAAAVLATEEGNKAVLAAVERVQEAGERLDDLSSTIHGAADAAAKIVAAAEQQVTGMGQISRAMHSIDQATSQTAEGTRQVERAAHDLESLAAKLREAAAHYRT
ncbi:MAG: methyl-accepting chemotaxis protein [Deltaproteobacteria bacterium]|nr:methyl-accepting chemotaxis protein [Deltaproteobacteria bacterium]